MCETWTDEQWRKNSKPEDPTSIYELVETYHNPETGEIASIYRENDNTMWAVRPGEGNYVLFAPYAYETPRICLELARTYLHAHGFSTVGLGDLVENLA